jgi:hypothetical protein
VLPGVPAFQDFRFSEFQVSTCPKMHDLVAGEGGECFERQVRAQNQTFRASQYKQSLNDKERPIVAVQQKSMNGNYVAETGRLTFTFTQKDN